MKHSKKPMNQRRTQRIFATVISLFIFAEIAASFTAVLKTHAEAKAIDHVQVATLVVMQCVNSNMEAETQTSIEATLKSLSKVQEQAENVIKTQISANASLETTTEVEGSSGVETQTEVDVESKVQTELETSAEPTAEANKTAETKTHPVLTRAGGVNYFNGHKETWYSERVLPGGGLRIPGRHTDEAGLVRDGDGYICVASSDYPKGTIVETSLGTGKVYDCGCPYNVIVIYTNW